MAWRALRAMPSRHSGLALIAFALAAGGCGRLWTAHSPTSTSESTPAAGSDESTAAALDGAAHPCARPRLIVQITVDQLRGDLIARYLEGFGEAGFRRFVDAGVWYLDANYRHAITETAPGHATLATGADPSIHGIVANDWLDASTGALVYNTADSDSPLVGGDESPRQGRSARNLLASTVADQMVTASAGRARAFAVSVKDRGAILPAGRLGTPFWYDKSSGRFISSRFYAKQLPAWLERFNESKPHARYAGTEWTLVGEPESYVFGARDAQPWERGAGAFGETFPHAYGQPDEPGFFAKLAFSPAGDALTLKLVEALFEAEDLGNRAGVTEYLSVSFSSTDYVGHAFGPSSLESEDNLRRLDGLLARLLALIDARVGLEHALVVLSADHGVAEAPEERAAQGFAAAHLTSASFDFAAVDAYVADRLGSEARLYASVRAPYVWLDAEAVRSAGLDMPGARELLAEAFVAQPSVRAVFTREQLSAHAQTDDPLLRRARRSYFAARSGDLHLVPEPYTLLSLYGADDAGLTASHGTPWRYDTHVPILALGAGLKARRVARPVGPHAIAPSLALRAAAPLPSGAVGDVLAEVVRCD